LVAANCSIAIESIRRPALTHSGRRQEDSNRWRLLAEHPKGIDALRKLTGTIDAEHMRRMNRAVDEDGASPAAVAPEFLDQLL